MSPQFKSLIFSFAMLAGIAGCSEGGTTPNGAPQDPPGEFVSDNPDPNAGSGGGYSGGADAGANSPGASGAAGSSSDNEKDDPQKAILEADIIQVQGDKLYALSQYGGLAIVDISNPDQLKMLGRWRVAGMPFEMYLQDGVVLAMYSSFYHLEWNDSSKYAEWVTSSRVVALDVSNPAAIQPIANFDIPGEVSDSRIVGNVMYVVSYENGYCWECSNAAQTTVTSLNVADPHAIAKVDQLNYPDATQGYSWGKRSISVTQDRMFVAGPEYGNWSADGGYNDHSTIKVVDITDPAGDLVEGADIPVEGQIESRWQMDESQGVLRVISQPGSWNPNDGAPVVQTFQMVSSNEVKPLGKLTMSIPANERLQSVRFDGNRGYAVTFVQTDPLFVIDLTDPANPKQAGELQMPGFLYHMEPRGDRMIALGRDNGNDAGGLTVSVFNVADINNPTMLSRVNFGSEWGWLPEDQDRIHKAFRIFDTDNLIVVPFSGSTYDKNGCYSYGSGVQLIDLFGDQLTARGVVPQHGQARRAMLHKGRLLAVSDDRVSSFDITDRDHPALKSNLAFVHKAYQSKVVGQVVAQVSSDWWTNKSTLVISPIADPERGNPLAELDLEPLLKKADQTCSYYYSNGLYDARLFANGNKLYMLWNEGYYYYDYNDPNQSQPQTAIAVFDLTDPYHPVIEGVARLQVPMGWSWYYPGYAWGYGWESGVVSAGQSVVQNGSTLAVLGNLTPYYYYSDPNQTKPAPTVYLISLANPAAPTLAGQFPLPAATTQTMLQIDGSTLMSSHSEPLQSDPSKVKFYLDRYDISNPAAPQALDPVNVPGSLLSFDHGTNRAMTVDYIRENLGTIPYSDCYAQGGRPDSYDYYYNDAGVGCTRYHRIFKLAQLQGSGATLLDSIDVDDGQIQSISVGQDRVFVMRGSWSYYYWGDSTQEPPKSTMQMISGIVSGDLQASTPIVVDNDPYSWGRIVAVSGHKAILHGDYPPHLAVYDSSNPSQPTLIKKADLFGYVYQVEVTNNTAICSLGEWGLQSIPLGN